MRYDNPSTTFKVILSKLQRDVTVEPRYRTAQPFTLATQNKRHELHFHDFRSKVIQIFPRDATLLHASVPRAI